MELVNINLFAEGYCSIWIGDEDGSYEELLNKEDYDSYEEKKSYIG